MKHTRFKRSLPVTPLIYSTTRHGCPVPSFTSPSHHGVCCTLEQRRFSWWLHCSCICFHSTHGIASYNIRASFHRSRCWATKLYLHRWEIFVSSTSLYFERRLRMVDPVALLALLPDCLTPLASITQNP